MNKVNTIRAVPAVEYNTVDNTNPKGVLSAYTYVDISDIFGNKRIRKLSLGYAHNIDLDNAKRLIEDARKNNPSVHANLNIAL